jgi:hypothetical protein
MTGVSMRFVVSCYLLVPGASILFADAKNSASLQLYKVIECPSADGRSERIEMTENNRRFVMD